jgi:hypothetical protein
MITASMSTIAWREPGLARAVASVLPQVDCLNVFLQGYAVVPDYLRNDKISIVRDISASASARLGASAKFHWLWHGAVAEGYHFTVDDDIVYPADYVDRCIRKIDEHDRRVVVGFHGLTYPERMVRYFKDRRAWPYDHGCDSDRFVHALGTGTASFHTSALRLVREDFAQPNSCDLYLGIACQRQRVPMLCLERKTGYLKPLPLGRDKRGCGKAPDYDRRMIEIFNTWSPWEIR